MTTAIDFAFRILTGCQYCTATWWKPWPTPEPDDGVIRNHGICGPCLDVKFPNVSAVARANEEGV